ncbi:hypothetical protein MBRA1_001910 [Malassezia brasiliensis]|uniref:Rab-GAP TBC domain-containing protein n=1 Tax=Malassezia brasiliensis TaxID=1821822 RepID=A0AAF0DSI6_9BASI|nr:hypothetical protein MBRA1_001910 [Malassezia brasiliensis]
MHAPPTISHDNDGAMRTLAPLLTDRARQVLQDRTPRAELVEVLAQLVKQLIQPDETEEVKLVSPTAPSLSRSLREAMMDDLVGPPTADLSPMPVEANTEAGTDALSWLQSIVLDGEPSACASPQRIATPSTQPGSRASSPVPSETALPMAPVVELAHMVPVESRPPPFLPPLQDEGIQIDRYGFLYTHESSPSVLSEVYDAYQAERKAQWDAYLAAEYTHHETPWQDLFHTLRQLDHSTSTGQATWRAFQRLCQQGIPMCYRPMVWSQCVRAAELAEPGLYQDLVAGASHDDRQIALDARRTMPTNSFFGGKGPGVEKLQRLLEAQCAWNPAQGYCQGMNNLAAILLLTYTHEEDAFWTMSGIIQHILPDGFYASNMRVPQADQRVLLGLVRAGMPKVHAHFAALSVELPAVTYAWFLSLFTSCLPIETLFRVWDMMLVDGHIVLFRVAYAILAHAAPALLAASSASAVYHVLHDAAAKWVDAESLVQAVVQLRTTIRVSEVTMRRTRALTQL